MVKQPSGQTNPQLAQPMQSSGFSCTHNGIPCCLLHAGAIREHPTGRLLRRGYILCIALCLQQQLLYLRHNLLYLKTNVTLTISLATAKGSKNFTERAFLETVLIISPRTILSFDCPGRRSASGDVCRGSGEADLVVVCRFAGIRVVEMPVEGWHPDGRGQL